jgi:hypothetical protein
MKDRGAPPLFDDDALDREIREALAVDPSPAFLPRVRQRISSDSAAPRHTRWVLAMAAAIGAIVIAVLIWAPSRGPEASLSGPSTAGKPGTQGGSVAPRTSAPAAATRATASASQASGSRTGRDRPSQPPEPPSSINAAFPEVIVSDVQVQAIRRLVTEAREALQPEPAAILTRAAESNHGIDLPPIHFAQVPAEPVVFERVMLEQRGELQ